MNRGDLSKPLSVAGHRALLWHEGRQRSFEHDSRGVMRFVEAREVARACAIDLHQLDTRYRPDEWACPRDFVFASGRVLMYAKASLPQLAATLEAAGQADAASKLRTWIAAGSGGKDATIQPESENVPTATAPARTPDKGGWATDWERKQP